MSDKPEGAKNPIIAVVLSFIIAGLGQVYNGQVARGIVLFISAVILSVTIIGGVLVWLFSMYDAYNNAVKINKRLGVEPETRITGIWFVIIIAALILAVFAVLIVGIVLWQLGIFSGIDSAANQSTGFFGGKIGLIDASIQCNANGNLNAIIVNQAGSAITIDSTASEVSGDCKGIAVSPETLKAGGQSTLALTGCSGAAGDMIATEVTLDYTETVAGQTIERTQTGQILCTVEPA